MMVTPAGQAGQDVLLYTGEEGEWRDVVPRDRLDMRAKKDRRRSGTLPLPRLDHC